MSPGPEAADALVGLQPPVTGRTWAGSEVCADLLLRVGQNAAYLAAEVDVAGVSGLPRPGIGRQLGEGGPQRRRRLVGLDGGR